MKTTKIGVALVAAMLTLASSNGAITSTTNLPSKWVRGLEEHIRADAKAISVQEMDHQFNDWQTNLAKWQALQHAMATNKVVDASQTTNANTEVSKGAVQKPEVLRRWLSRYGKKDAGLFLNRLATSLSDRERGLVLKRIGHLAFPQIGVRFEDQDMLAWVTGTNVFVSPALLARSYQAFRQVVSHELTHYFIEGGKEASRNGVHSYLAEGVTEYLTIETSERLGWKESDAKAYGDMVRMTAVFMALGERDKLISWYVAEDKAEKQSVLDAALEQSLVTRGVAADEAGKLIGHSHIKGLLSDMEMVKVSLTGFEIMPLQLEAMELSMQFGAAKSCRELFGDLRTNILTATNYAVQIKSGCFDEFLKTVGKLAPLLEFPARITSTVVPLLQEEIDRQAGREAKAVATNEITARFEKAAEGLEGKARLVRLLKENDAMLRSDLIGFRDKLIAIEAEAEKIKADIKALAREHDRLEHLSDTIIGELVKSPFDRVVILAAPIPAQIKTELEPLLAKAGTDSGQSKK